MSILSSYAVTVTPLNPVSRADGQGGRSNQWQEGQAFPGWLLPLSAERREQAGQDTASARWRLYLRPERVMPWHQAFRLGDGQICRVTSRTAARTPEDSGLDLCALDCEEWRLI